MNILIYYIDRYNRFYWIFQPDKFIILLENNLFGYEKNTSDNNMFNVCMNDILVEWKKLDASLIYNFNFYYIIEIINKYNY